MLIILQWKLLYYLTFLSWISSQIFLKNKRSLQTSKLKQINRRIHTYIYGTVIWKWSWIKSESQASESRNFARAEREREKGGRWMKGKGESVILVCLNLSWNPWQQATISHQIIALGNLKRSLMSPSPSYALFSLSNSDISVEKSKRSSFINSGLSPFLFLLYLRLFFFWQTMLV